METNLSSVSSNPAATAATESQQFQAFEMRFDQLLANEFEQSFLPENIQKIIDDIGMLKPKTPGEVQSDSFSLFHFGLSVVHSVNKGEGNAGEFQTVVMNMQILVADYGSEDSVDHLADFWGKLRKESDEFSDLDQWFKESLSGEEFGFEGLKKEPANYHKGVDTYRDLTIRIQHRMMRRLDALSVVEEPRQVFPTTEIIPPEETTNESSDDNSTASSEATVGLEDVEETT